jgi:hypothetical protein
VAIFITLRFISPGLLSTPPRHTTARYSNHSAEDIESNFTREIGSDRTEDLAQGSRFRVALFGFPPILETVDHSMNPMLARSTGIRAAGSEPDRTRGRLMRILSLTEIQKSRSIINSTGCLLIARPIVISPTVLPHLSLSTRIVPFNRWRMAGTGRSSKAPQVIVTRCKLVLLLLLLFDRE